MDVFFLTKYGHESSLFFREWTIFLTKYGHESIDFFVKNRKKRASYWLFWPIILVLTELTSFDYIWACQQGVFHEKFEKNYMTASCFWEKGRFFDKIWAWEQFVFLENGRFFDKIWAWVLFFFREKSEEKGIILTFLTNNIVYFWQNWRWFDQIWAWQHGISHEKFEKNDMRALCFWEDGRFSDKIWAWEQLDF